MKRLLFLAGLVLVAPAAAQPALSQARAAGQVGERYDGYLGVAGAAPTLVRREVETINIRRRSHYSNLAASRAVSPQDVGLTAGCMTLGSVDVGEAYLLADNVWRRRDARASAPVPSYCRP